MAGYARPGAKTRKQIDAEKIARLDELGDPNWQGSRLLHEFDDGWTIHELCCSEDGKEQYRFIGGCYTIKGYYSKWGAEPEDQDYGTGPFYTKDERDTDLRIGSLRNEKGIPLASILYASRSHIEERTKRGKYFPYRGYTDCGRFAGFKPYEDEGDEFTVFEVHSPIIGKDTAVARVKGWIKAKGGQWGEDKKLDMSKPVQKGKFVLKGVGE